ncbi:unnamed protein product [Prorocentrum cordatum]|uniref:Secreted protein n=1 Tax=Prorocentrum cordatum TaxID=2364126 RepID=A0ABN9VA95_9DINO|nr:unnamed protein product [Polarella glacialis]
MAPPVRSALLLAAVPVRVCVRVVVWVLSIGLRCLLQYCHSVLSWLPMNPWPGAGDKRKARLLGLPRGVFAGDHLAPCRRRRVNTSDTAEARNLSRTAHVDILKYDYL